MSRLYTVDRAMEIAELMDITPAELCRRAGLSVSTISRAYNRKNELTFQTVLSICRASDITLADFYAGIDHILQLEKKY